MAGRVGEPDGDPPPYPPFEILGTRRLYDSPWCGLRRDELRLPNGKAQEYHVVEIPDAVVVAPFLPDGSIVMVWQHRHPHGGTHWEVPAGRIARGEEPAAAATRELREETGYRAGELVALPGFYPINGISAHFAHAFAAYDCERVGAPELDASERMVTRVLSRARVERMLREGSIRDGFTRLALREAFAHAR